MLSKTTFIRVALTTSIAASALTMAPPAAGQEVCEVVADTPFGFASAPNSLSCGGPAEGDNSTVYGDTSNVDTEAAIGAVAVGFWATVNGSASAAPNLFGFLPVGDLGSIAIGSYAGANGDNSVAVGSAARVGLQTFATQHVVNGGTAIGVQASVQAHGGTAAGFSASVTGLFATAVGHASNVAGDLGSAFGFGSNAGGNFATAIGSNSFVAGEYAVGLGYGVNAADRGAIAIGFRDVFSDQTIAQGENAIAVGTNANAGTDNAIAMGHDSRASGTNGVAFGNGAEASGNNAVALGAGSIADEDDSVSVGATGNERRITNVAAGVNATDAVNLGQLQGVTGDVSGLQTDVTTLQTNVATNTTAINSHTTAISNLQTGLADANASLDSLEAAQTLVQGQVDTLFDLRDQDRRDMKQGVAAAIAIANAPMPSAPGKISYAVNGATFRGEYALGGSLMYRLPTRTPVAVNAGFAFAGNKNNGARIGIAGEF